MSHKSLRIECNPISPVFNGIERSKSTICISVNKNGTTRIAPFQILSEQQYYSRDITSYL